MADQVKTGGFGWDDEVDSEASANQPLLPVGPALFVVIKFERKREEFGKFGILNIAHVTMSVATKSDESIPPVVIDKKLGLHTDLQWKITEFFTSIGQRKHGDKGKFVPDWSKVDGSSGLCETAHREVTSKKGTKYTVNDITKFLSGDEVVTDGQAPRF